MYTCLHIFSFLITIYLLFRTLYVYTNTFFSELTSKSVAYSKMTPKRHEYSNDLRTKVIEKFLKGVSQCQITSDVIIPRTSIQKTIQKCKTTKCIQNLKGRGQEQKTTIRVDWRIERKLKCDRRKPSRIVKVALVKHLVSKIWKSWDRQARSYSDLGKLSCIYRSR